MIFGEQAKQVVVVYVSIYRRYISQWMAKRCRKSRAQTALLRGKAQFPEVFEGYLRSSPCVLCIQDFVAKLWTYQTVPQSSKMHINPLKTKRRLLY